MKWLGYFVHRREGIAFKAVIDDGNPVTVKVVRRLPEASVRCHLRADSIFLSIGVQNGQIRDS